jgi:ABC-type multidrug transport system fused ATPase/permease subunit
VRPLPATSVVRLMLALPLSDPGVPETGSPGRFLLWCARRQARVLMTGSVFGIVWMVSQAMIPLALGAGLGAVVRHSKREVVIWSLVVLGLGLLQAAAGILRHRRAVASFLTCASRVQQLVVRSATALGGDLARRVATGEVANIGASDIERVGDALDVVARFSGGVVSYVVVALVLLVVSPPLGAIVVLGVPLAVLAVAPVLRPLERRQTAERDRRSDASSVAADTVTGLRVLRGLGGEQVFARRYARASDQVAMASVQTANMQALLDGAQVILPGAIVVAVTWVGSHLAVEGSLSAGDLVAFYASAAFLVIPMQTFVEAASKWTAAVVAARRIIAVLTMQREMPTVDGPDPAELPTGDLLDEETGARIVPGLMTAVVPSTPEEGTALLERLARWVDPRPGSEVRWADETVNQFPLDWYRAHVVMLERSPFHLRGTVRELLVPGERKGRAQAPPTGGQPGAGSGLTLDAALRAAEASDVVEALPDGIGTALPEQWRTLSGGQRQRLSLAQALLSDADVLLLDDPTSAVDAHTEAAIARFLVDARRGRTTVVTTTSPLVAEQADVVVVLDGTARTAGRHEQLLSKDAGYESQVVRGGTA